MANFRRYRVWARAHELTLSVYCCTSSFPNEETYGLTAQVRRAAVSIPANLAEGLGWDGDRERARFAMYAMGSAYEVEYHLLLAHDLGYLDTGVYETLLKQLVLVRRMLGAFRKKLTAGGGRRTANG